MFTLSSVQNMVRITGNVNCLERVYHIKHTRKTAGFAAKSKTIQYIYIYTKCTKPERI